MLGLLAVWRALGLDKILRECWESGVVLAGLSRGRDVLVRVGRDDVARARRRPRPASASCPGSMSVHMDGEPARLPVCRAAIADGTIPPGYAADDGVALLFRGTELEEVVSSRPNRRALRIEPGRREPSSSRACSRARTASARRRRSPSSGRAVDGPSLAASEGLGYVRGAGCGEWLGTAGTEGEGSWRLSVEARTVGRARVARWGMA